MERSPCRTFLVALFLIISVFSRAPAATAQEKHPVAIAVSPWVGYGPLYVAKDKGFFGDLVVQINIVKDLDKRISQLMGGYAQIVAVPVDAMVAKSRRELGLRAFMVIDESAGGDGVVARKGIGRLEDLSGKRVALGLFSPSDFWFDYLLEERDLEDLKNEITFVNLVDLEALAAMRKGQVDAMIGREPFLSSAARELGASIIADSRQTPGRVVDVLFSQADTIAARHDDFETIVRGVYRAVDWMEKNPAAARSIIRKYLGQSYRVSSDFENTFSAVRFYDRDMDLRYFGTADDPGDLEQTLDDSIDYLKDMKELSWNPDPEDFIDFSLVPTLP
jgi:NitT/TauT family transport system substrate-binding protein